MGDPSFREAAAENRLDGAIRDELDNQVITEESEDTSEGSGGRTIGDEFHHSPVESVERTVSLSVTVASTSLHHGSIAELAEAVAGSSSRTPSPEERAYKSSPPSSPTSDQLQLAAFHASLGACQHAHPPLGTHDSAVCQAFAGHAPDYSMMAATTAESVFLNLLVKNEPEDLTGHRERQDSTDGSISCSLETDTRKLSLDKPAMGIINSENGDHVTLLTEDVHLAPGFSSSYDSAPFYPGDPSGRLYPGERYPEDLYPGEPGYRGSYTAFPSTDLPSPDSGIGEQISTPRGMVESDTSFEFTKEPYSTQHILNENTIRKPWHDYGSRNSDTEKVQIPKVYSPFGFHYILDAPTSSSVRREDDKVTYVNKGQFYGVTLDYQPDPDHGHLKSPTVKSVIMLVFRDGKSEEEELKAWQFWHHRQHSVKQRIIDVDTKNSLGLVGHIEELSHNALAVYWNPLDSPAKVNLAVQCLSTDFSTQKGVKGLPLHVQIDTFDDPRADIMEQPTHRGYCQVKIFCDKGAERKLRDEERRAAKRRMTPSGKRRLDEMYHETFDRSEFYSMSDLSKPPTLFTPPEDPEKTSQHSNDFAGFVYPPRPAEPMKAITNGDLHPGLMSVGSHQQSEKTVLPYSDPKPKRPRIIPPTSERIMIYVRQETEEMYTPLHLVPPSVPGLIASIENKYKISAQNIRFLYRKNRDGIIAKIDDDMLRHYCNEDVFLMQVMVTESPCGSEDTMVYDITLSEMASAMEH